VPSEAPPELHVEVTGTGPTIVLMHGFGGSARNFGPQARAFGKRWRVVRFDARGHGRSEAPADPDAYRPEAFVADVGRVLDRVGADRAVVGGLSMGAAVAVRFALAHPERVRALVLAAFPPGARVGGFAAVAGPFADAIEREGLEAAGARYAWGPSSGLDETGAQLVRQGFLEHPPQGLAHTLRGLLAVQPSAEELAPQAATLAMPTLLIVGGNDRRSLAASRVLASAMPAARLVVVEGAGHIVNLADPAAFNAAVEEFLDAVAT
jgi:pimeloyl-ACP methyl ester carboxylesterase